MIRESTWSWQSGSETVKEADIRIRDSRWSWQSGSETVKEADIRIREIRCMELAIWIRDSKGS